jgi:uncharacterized membrane protein YhaH (DUF805 family)/ssDNA-binding Zn-finger/Zn-ribbon topoisomerase 1
VYNIPMQKQGNNLSDTKGVFCINCCAGLSLNLSQRRGDTPIVCSSCKGSFSLKQAEEFLEKINPLSEGKCPNCLEELTFDIKERVTEDLIECPRCQDKFYMSEVIPLSSGKEENEVEDEGEIGEVGGYFEDDETEITDDQSRGAFYFYKKAFKEYSNFRGRATRREFWSFFIINFSISSFLYLLLLTEIDFWFFIYLIYSFFAFLPTLSILVRRLHDTNKSGWNYFISLIPIAGPIILLLYLLEDSYPEGNQYGSPRE